ncbi:MAG: hypothetical protein K2I74_03135 [Treponemataceae bacterium]|nr:hypothetical protein [Treponemataceae bacterium]
MAKSTWAAFLKIRNDEIDLGRLPRFAESRKSLLRSFRIVRKGEHRRGEVSAWRGSVNIVRAAFRMARKRKHRSGQRSARCGMVQSSRRGFRMVRNGNIIRGVPHFAEKEVLMVGNIIACAVLAAWLVAAVAFLLRKRRAAKKSGHPACAGCSGSCGCCGER